MRTGGYARKRDGASSRIGHIRNPAMLAKHRPCEKSPVTGMCWTRRITRRAEGNSIQITLAVELKMRG
jgi:hypothetical protein